MNQQVRHFLAKNGVWIGFFVLATTLSILTGGGFLQPRNLTNLLRQTSINGILASGMTMIILLGGIDLSIGSVVGLCGICVGITQVNWGWGASLSMTLGSAVMAMGVGTFAGFLTGGLISVTGIAPFVISLGMMVIARGLAMIFSGGTSISPMGEALQPLADSSLSIEISALLLVAFVGAFLYLRRKEKWDLIFPMLTFLLLSYAFVSYHGIPWLVMVMVAVLLVIGLILNQTTFGRSIYAIGSSERAAFWAGVPVRKVLWIVYTIMGALAGLASLLLTARLNGADPNSGQLFELDAIAAVVIGGTSLKGGSGSIMGTFIGALTIATLNNGMDLLGVPSFYQMVFKGLIIIVAVALDSKQRVRGVAS